MFYKKFFLRLIALCCLFIAFIACSSSGSDDDLPSTEPEIITPSNLVFTIDIDGADNNNNPNGDGSGVIQCTISATDAVSYNFRPGTGAETNNATGIFEFTYTEQGTHNYTVTVLAYSSTGHSIRESREINISVSTHSNLVWSDEFNVNGSPNSSKWVYDLGDGCPNICGWGNSESQYYTNSSDNILIEDGVLKIITKKENHLGLGYTSARIKTQGKYDFKYGKVEVRAKLPSGGGTWPAIWMLGTNITTVGWPACGEIDIMEHKGNNVGTVSSAMHTPSSYGNTANKGETYISDATNEFHVYTVNWTSEKIEFSVDDVIHYTYNPSVHNSATWPFDANQFLILNVAMGGGFGGDIDPDFTESLMEIDYVRVYQ